MGGADRKFCDEGNCSASRGLPNSYPEWHNFQSAPHNHCRFFFLHILPSKMTFEPAHEIMVLITWATSKGSGKPAHWRCLARALAVRAHEIWKQTKGPTRNKTSSPTGWLRMCNWRTSLQRAKSAIISWAGSFKLKLCASFINSMLN